ncbi:MAG: hypothetical protein PHE89_03015 [Alphaproteobacteria bacterium]|nr:hypothetical protein [Alphaproteobacteria bacterium]
MQHFLTQQELLSLSDLNYINRSEISKKFVKLKNGLHSNIKGSERSHKLIVSLTSFPQRINEVAYTVYSILSQTTKPDKVILWLGKNKFPEKEQNLPKPLQEMISKGLEVRFVDDLKAYTKIIYALQEFPEDIVVTADDDIFYPEDWLENLYEAHLQAPQTIFTNRAKVIKIIKDKTMSHRKWYSFSGIANGMAIKIETSRKWKRFNHPLHDKVSSNRIFFNGKGGVLYPPHCFYKDVIKQEVFATLVPFEDNIWLWGMAVLKETEIKVLKNNIKHLTYVNPERELKLSQEKCLSYGNFSYKANDMQINSLLRKYPDIITKLAQK